jgi:surface polysaccharide O-acyltransferase-like enzyme
MIIFLAKLIIKRKITNPFYTSFKNLIQQDYFWQFWFFGTMIIIYLILPILYKYFNDYKTAIILTVTFIAISLTIDLLNLIRSFNGYSIIQLHIIQTFRLWTWFAYFLLGGLLGKEKVKNFFLNHINNITNWCILSASIIIISIYQYNVGILYKKSNLEYFYDNIFTFIYSISLFILIYRQNFKQNKIIKIMSNNIMGIYIVHVTVIKIFTHFYKFNTPILNISFIFIVFICSLILTLVISKIPLFNRLIKIS